MTPDPSTNLPSPAAASSGPTPPERFEPTPPAGPTDPVPPPASPTRVPPPVAASPAPATPDAAKPAAAKPAAATPGQVAAAETLGHTGAAAPVPPPQDPPPVVVATPPPGSTALAAAVAEPAAVPPPATGVAPAPGQLAAAAEIVSRGASPEPEAEGLGTAVKVGIAAVATAAAGAAVAAVASALTGGKDDAAKTEGGPADAPATPSTTPTAPLAARMKGVEPGETKPVTAEPHVPHVAKEGELGGEALVKVATPPGAAPKAAPPLPRSPQGIAIPKSAELDKELEEAIAAGLGDDALSLQMNAGAAKAGAGGPAIAGTDPATGKGPGQPIGGDEAATPAPMIGDEESIEPGTKLMGKVDSKTDSDLFINLERSRLQGIIPRTDYPDGNGPPVGFNGAFFVDNVDVENGLIHLQQSPRPPQGDRRLGQRHRWPDGRMQRDRHQQGRLAGAGRPAPRLYAGQSDRRRLRLRHEPVRRPADRGSGHRGEA